MDGVGTRCRRERRSELAVSALRAALLALALGSVARAQEPGGFRLLGTYRGLGGQFASTIAPGRTPGSERLYASYMYMGNTLDVTGTDPATGATQVYRSPVAGEYGARCMVTGPDGNVYMGTLPNAHLLRLDTRADRLVDLGRPIPGETFIWDVIFGPDGKLYAGTQPNAKLARFDPGSGKLEDLGQLDREALFVHSLAASDNGFIYGGTGPSRMNVVAYEIATGAQQAILPAGAQKVGTAAVWRAADGKTYAQAGEQYFVLDRFTAKPVGKAPSRVWPGRMRDGRYASMQGSSVVIKDLKTGATEEHPHTYRGEELPVFRIGFGPDGRLYSSSELPARLLRFEETRAGFDELGDLGGGEVYMFLPQGHELLMAAYGSLGPLMAFDTTRPFQKAGPGQNPEVVSWPGADESWRTFAGTVGSDGKAYFGGLAGYGKLGGPLVSWDRRKGSVEAFPIMHDESVSALGVWGDKLVVGTTIYGGMGANPTQKDARVVLWDPLTRKVIYNVEPIPGAVSIENLVVAPNGVMYGIAARKMFTFDLQKRTVGVVKDLPFPGGTVYGSMGVGPDGRIWGLAPNADAGIFVIDPRTNDIRLAARAPKPITAGFTIRGDHIYFASQGEVYRYAIPSRRAE
jgi:streptogramin lyase